MVVSKIGYCLVCGKEISQERRRTGKAKYCSPYCTVNAYKARKRIRLYEEDREFIGYFCGEGFVTINRSRLTDKRYMQFSPILGINIRDDDKKILEWIKNRYGGYVYQNGKRKIVNQNGKTYIQNPTVGWKLHGLEKLEKLLLIMLEAKIPAKKLEEVKVLKEFVNLKLSWRRKHWPRQKFYPKDMVEKFEYYTAKLHEMKKYH